MWYFTWILGLGFAVIFALVNALWLESQMERAADVGAPIPPAKGSL